MNQAETQPALIIKPTVGRKVWYRPSKHDVAGIGGMTVAGHIGAGAPDPALTQPLDATVLAVWGDRMINVTIRDAYGKVFNKTSVTLLQPGDEPPKDADGNHVGGYCEWMPYQTAQAAKQ